MARRESVNIRGDFSPEEVEILLHAPAGDIQELETDIVELHNWHVPIEATPIVDPDEIDQYDLEDDDEKSDWAKVMDTTAERYTEMIEREILDDSKQLQQLLSSSPEIRRKIACAIRGYREGRQVR